MLTQVLIAVSTVIVLFTLGGCSDDEATAPASVPTSGAVAVTPDSPAPTPTEIPSQQAETFGETLQGDALKWYDSLPQVNRNDIEFFASALGHDAAGEWINRALPEVDAYGMSPHLTAPLPSFADSLSADETAKLQSLDQRIEDAFTESWEFGVAVQAPVSPPSDPASYVEGLVTERVKTLRELLMAIPAAIPPAEAILHPDELAAYETLHPELRELFWLQTAKTYAQGLTVGRGEFPALNETQVKDLFSQFIPSLVTQGKSCSDHSQPCL